MVMVLTVVHAFHDNDVVMITMVVVKMMVMMVELLIIVMQMEAVEIVVVIVMVIAVVLLRNIFIVIHFVLLVPFVKFAVIVWITLRASTIESSVEMLVR